MFKILKPTKIIRMQMLNHQQKEKSAGKESGKHVTTYTSCSCICSVEKCMKEKQCTI